MKKPIAEARCFAFVSCMALLAANGAAQEVPSILVVEVENYVAYVGDTTDPARVARSSAAVTPTAPLNFFSNLILADVTSVNGAPAKGVMVIRAHNLLLTPTPTPGRAIADVARTTVAETSWEFLKPDGSPIGNIFVMGLSAGTPPPGSPPAAAAGANAIVGGTGSFLGARGTMSSIEVLNARSTSQAEDPSVRRTNGGGRARFVFQIFPIFRPEVVAGPNGPEIFHADATPVTAEKPARRGEELTLNAKGLGPTNPAFNIGDPFPGDPPALATAPVEVLVNGKSTPATRAVGAPGAAGAYRVGFRVPDETSPGTASVQISAAWMKGATAPIPVE